MARANATRSPEELPTVSTSSSPTGELHHSPTVQPSVAKRKRLQSLDVFRGITILLMVFANSGGGHYWWINHATWNGLHVADVLFPCFLWIMGVCLPISLRSQMAMSVCKNTLIGRVLKVNTYCNTILYNEYKMLSHFI